MNKIIAAVALATVVFSAAPAYAITSAQRVAYLKYYQCLQSFYVVDKTLCHL